MMDEKVIGELSAWWLSETQEFRELVLKLLGSLPGGEDLEQEGYSFDFIGWKEIDLIGKVLNAVNDSEDVRDFIAKVIVKAESE